MTFDLFLRWATQGPLGPLVLSLYKHECLVDTENATHEKPYTIREDLETGKNDSFLLILNIKYLLNI